MKATPGSVLHGEKSFAARWLTVAPTLHVSLERFFALFAEFCPRSTSSNAGPAHPCFRCVGILAAGNPYRNCARAILFFIRTQLSDQRRSRVWCTHNTSDRQYCRKLFVGFQAFGPAKPAMSIPAADCVSGIGELYSRTVSAPFLSMRVQTPHQAGISERIRHGAFDLPISRTIFPPRRLCTGAQNPKHLRGWPVNRRPRCTWLPEMVPPR